METIKEDLIYWGFGYSTSDNQLKKNSHSTLLAFSIQDMEERIKKRLTSKSKQYKQDNIFEIWSCTKNEEDFKLIATYKR